MVITISLYFLGDRFLARLRNVGAIHACGGTEATLVVNLRKLPRLIQPESSVRWFDISKIPLTFHSFSTLFIPSRLQLLVG